MKNTIIISAFLTLAFVSCSKEAFEEVTSVPIKVYTCSDETKTAIASDGLTINWSAGDKISVIDNFGVNNCLTASTSGSSSTTFEGNVSKGSTQLYAVYPYAASASASGSVVKTTLPATQTAVNGNIPANTNIAVASASKGPSANEVTMNFKNACMFIKFKVPSTQSGVTSVVFSSANGTNLAGTVSVNAASSEPVASVVSNGSSSVTLSGTISAGGTYYLVVPAVTINGFSITLNGSSASISRSSTRTLEGVRGKVWDLSEIAFSAAVSASIDHVYSTDGTLTGSTMTVTPSFPAGDSANWQIKVYDKNGALVRSASGTAPVATVTTAASGKPYLPQTLGPYRVNFSYTTVNGSTITTTSATTVSSDAPTFTAELTSTPKSAYDYYLDGDIATANKKEGSTVYDISGKCSISSDVLKQLNGTVRINDAQTNFDKTLSSNSLSFSTGRWSSFGKKTIHFDVTFDGVTAKSNTAEVILTGIPYTADKIKSVRNEWTYSGSYDYNDDFLDLGSAATSSREHQTCSKSFYIPGTADNPVTINVTADYKIYYGGGYMATTCTFTVGNTEVFSEESPHGAFNTKMTKRIETASAVFTTSKNTVTVDNSYGMGATGTEVFYLKFYYR